MFFVRRRRDSRRDEELLIFSWFLNLVSSQTRSSHTTNVLRWLLSFRFVRLLLKLPSSLFLGSARILRWRETGTFRKETEQESHWLCNLGLAATGISSRQTYRVSMPVFDETKVGREKRVRFHFPAAATFLLNRPFISFFSPQFLSFHTKYRLFIQSVFLIQLKKRMHDSSVIQCHSSNSLVLLQEKKAVPLILTKTATLVVFHPLLLHPLTRRFMSLAESFYYCCHSCFVYVFIPWLPS